MSMKELEESMVSDLKRWRNAENDSVNMVEEVKRSCGNELICIMDIIRNDAEMHTQVLQLLVDGMEKKPLNLSRNGGIRGLVEEHIALKRSHIEEVNALIENIRDKAPALHRFLPSYLLEDSKKHEAMLKGLASMKESMRPIGRTKRYVKLFHPQALRSGDQVLPGASGSRLCR